jgi:hypothetical protein
VSTYETALGSLRGAAFPGATRSQKRLLPHLLTGATAALVGVTVVASPSLDRFLVAGVLLAVLVPLTVIRPATAILLTFAFLPILGVVRRLLIAPAGWSSHDPLLLVAPAVALSLVFRLFVMDGRPLLTDRLSKVIAALLAVACLEVVNPAGGGLTVGVGGLLFVGAPLLWFFVGRELLDRGLAIALMKVVAIFAVAIAVYGLYQTQAHFPSWDRSWLALIKASNPLGGYGSLSIGTSVRPFGTMASASEYLMLLGAGIAICVAFAPRLRYLSLLALPILGAALFLGSGRAPLLLCGLAVASMIALRVGPRRAPLLALLGAAVLLLGGLFVMRPALERVAAKSGNPLVVHEVEGLGNPFNESQSTLPTHIRSFRLGIDQAVADPFGRGTGSTNAASQRLGGDPQASINHVQHNGVNEAVVGTDIDVSNMFFALGFAGGVLYLAVLCVVAIRLRRAWIRSGDLALLAVIGIGIATLGQWLTGGHYLLAPFIWLLLGWATRIARPAGIDEAAAHAQNPR